MNPKVKQQRFLLHLPKEVDLWSFIKARIRIRSQTAGSATLIFSESKLCLPCGWVEIQNDKVAAGLDIVGDQGPVLVGLGLVLHHEVDHGAATVSPRVQVQRH
jgi:hypothetical protein